MELNEQEHAAIIAEFKEWREAKNYADDVKPARVYIDYCGELLESDFTVEEKQTRADIVKRCLGGNPAGLFLAWGGLGGV